MEMNSPRQRTRRVFDLLSSHLGQTRPIKARRARRHCAPALRELGFVSCSLTSMSPDAASLIGKSPVVCPIVVAVVGIAVVAVALLCVGNLQTLHVQFPPSCISEKDIQALRAKK